MDEIANTINTGFCPAQVDVKYLSWSLACVLVLRLNTLKIDRVCGQRTQYVGDGDIELGEAEENGFQSFRN